MADEELSEASRPIVSKSAPRRTRARKQKERIKVNVENLRKGSSSTDVELLQRRLKTRSAKLPAELQPEVTGTYDSRTQRAVREWQNRNGFTGGRGLRVSQVQAKLIFGDDYQIESS